MARQKVTLLDVAQHAGVSKWTASRAFTEGASISPSAKEKVLKAAHSLGYRPNLLARSLTTKRTNLIGLVVDELQNPYIFHVLDLLMERLQRQGMLSVVLNISAQDSYQRTIELAEQFQVDGLVFLGTSMDASIQRLIRHDPGLPCIALFRTACEEGVPYLSTDDLSATRSMAHELIAQGKRRFAYLAGPASTTSVLRREEGYLSVLAEYGLTFDQRWSVDHYHRLGAYESIKESLASLVNPWDVLLCENDILAIGALDALHEQGMKDVAVIGFDDIDLAASPQYALTTYQQPTEQILDRAIAYLLSGEIGPVSELFAGQWVYRRSHNPCA